MGAEESPGIIRDFAIAAQNVSAAGFDGVEIHVVSCHLLQQSRENCSNIWTNAHSRLTENRARVVFEVVDPGIAV
ncbi:hypothetical protein [Paracoccus sp. (in: a-proteobacteria)]|uniref:oxidoreductase n=1 Tax=Paracoccus sp. TaxID=267 RepID=UPI00396CD031